MAMHTNSPQDNAVVLSDLLELLTAALRADGILVSAGSSSGEPDVLASVPAGLVGRRLPLSTGLLATCGLGVHTTTDLLLPSAMTGWLGFRPAFVASLKIDLPESEGCLFAWWKDQPAEDTLIASLLTNATRLVADLGSRETEAVALSYMKDRFDAVLDNVSLGIAFVNLLRGSRLNDVAADILGIPVATTDTAAVVAAMQRVRAACTIETEEGVPAALSANASNASTAEYWIDPARNLVLRVESHPVSSEKTPGRFWVFTDVKPLWDSNEKVKSSNDVLQRNIALLAEEMERRIEAEAQLREFNLGLRQKNEELEIAKLESDLIANQDSLTGLANRRRFRRGLEEMITSAHRKGDRVAVVYLDLDRFKTVNDILGHERGDQLLRTVADTLTQVLRKDDLIARLGGDEFGCAMTLPSETTLAHVTALVQKLGQRLNIPVESPDQIIHVSASIGIALYPDDAEDAVHLLRAADNAMYLGKRHGGNEVIVFTRRNDSVSAN